MFISVHFGLLSANDADPDPAYHFDVDPDPAITLMPIRILPFNLMREANMSLNN